MTTLEDLHNLTDTQKNWARLIAEGWTIRMEHGRNGPRWVAVPPVLPNSGAAEE